MCRSPRPRDGLGTSRRPRRARAPPRSARPCSGRGCGRLARAPRGAGARGGGAPCQSRACALPFGNGCASRDAGGRSSAAQRSTGDAAAEPANRRHLRQVRRSTMRPAPTAPVVTPPGVRRLGLGLAALGRPGYITVEHARDLAGNYERGAMEQRTHAVLDAAYAGGVRYFDAARSYGRAEDFLASWLANRRIVPGAVVVASKWGYTYTAGWRADAERHEVKDHSLATLRRQLAETRARLRA